MGKYHLGPDEPRALALAAQHGVDTFVETGTYKGGTTAWAAKHFRHVYTIEAYAARYNALMRVPVLERPANAQYLFGDSRVELPLLLAVLRRPCMFWLDAHWCGEGAHDSVDECPLREELVAINADDYAAKHVIMIDDARLFEAPPPMPHDPAQWLTLYEVYALLGDRDVYLDKDIIYALPRGDGDRL